MLHSQIPSAIRLSAIVFGGLVPASTSVAQPFTPIDAARGIIEIVELSPGYDFFSDTMTDGFDPYQRSENGVINSPFGRFRWSVEHTSALSATRVSGCGSINADIAFESEGTAGAWLLSLLDTDFQLTTETTVRLRGRIQVQSDFAPPFTGYMVAFMYVELSSAAVTYFYVDAYDIFTDVPFDREYTLPPGSYTLTANAQIYGDEFHAWSGYMGSVAYRSILAKADCMADIREDGVIDVQDLAGLLSMFGMPTSCTDKADLDLDGDIDLADLTVLLSDFGTECPS